MAATPEKPTKGKRTRPAIFFIFRDESGLEQKAGLTLDLAHAIPNLASLLGGSPKAEYRYRGDVVPKAMSTYFRSVSARVKNQDFDGFSTLTPREWNSVFWLAFRLGDTTFYDNLESIGSPDLMDIAPLILEMPQPARLYYFGHYIGRCFGFDCECDRRRIKALRKEAREWIELQTPSDQQKYRNTPISGAFRKYKKYLTHTYDLEEKYKDEWMAENGYAIDAGQIFNWYELDMEIKVHLVHLQINLPTCVCKRPFYDKWNEFCQTLPPIAEFLWNNMKREELMRYAKTSDEKKDGIAARKNSFADLVAYIEFTKNR